jgi:hypothetical protein
MAKPLLFIGSSRQGLDIGQVLEELLEYDARINLWTSDVFGLGKTSIEALSEQLDLCDYAILVLTPDDLIATPEQERFAPRDNVVFEAGLFMGRLGRDRTFLVYDRESKPKLPSDFAGLTCATYDGNRLKENHKAALSPVASKIGRRLRTGVRAKEVDFIKAYISFVQPDTPLTDSYSEILSKHYSKIRSEILRLEKQSDWDSLLEVKRRLREYFEYSGRYLDGVEFGTRYVRALDEIGEQLEAIWTKVKHVGYLLILAGKHKAGRTVILDALSELKARDDSSDSARELLFYCYRYLGISFQRDNLSGNLGKAREFFEKADEVVGSFDKNVQKQNELRARLLGNLGNLALDSGSFATALESYQLMLDIFVERGDLEHIGIANLKVAEAIVASGKNLKNAFPHLKAAESVSLTLGWIEGQARVLEQEGRAYERLAAACPRAARKEEYRRKCVTAALNSKALFERIENQRGLGRVESLIERTKELTSTASPRTGRNRRSARGAKGKIARR